MNRGSPVFTFWPTFTATFTTIPGSGAPTEMFSVSGSTMPAPATELGKGFAAGCTGGGNFGNRSLACARYLTEKAMRPIARIGSPNLVAKLRSLEIMFVSPASSGKSIAVPSGSECVASPGLPLDRDDSAVVHFGQRICKFKNTTIVRHDDYGPIAFD